MICILIRHESTSQMLTYSMYWNNPNDSLIFCIQNVVGDMDHTIYISRNKYPSAGNRNSNSLWWYVFWFVIPWERCVIIERYLQRQFIHFNEHMSRWKHALQRCHTQNIWCLTEMGTAYPSREALRTDQILISFLKMSTKWEFQQTFTRSNAQIIQLQDTSPIYYGKVAWYWGHFCSWLIPGCVVLRTFLFLVDTSLRGVEDILLL
jgi:hypothetical protein